MALFTDGPISSRNDLRSYESAVLDLAGMENVDLTAKMLVAQREMATELTPFLVCRGVTRAQRDLGCVVVTDPLAHAHALRTLAMVYRDLYQSQLNDRFEGKWKAYERLADQAMRRLMDHGVGVVAAPLPKPAPPSIATINEGLLPARTLCVRVAWAGAGNSGSLSDPESKQMQPGTRAVVGASGDPERTNGWLVYAGTSPQNCRLQTGVPLQQGQTWTEPLTGLRTDLASWPVQSPDYFVVNRREWMRG